MISITNCPNPQVLRVDTTFNIQDQPHLKTIVENIEGVEQSQTFSVNKYSFIVEFGKLFDREIIKSSMLNAINVWMGFIDESVKQPEIIIKHSKRIRFHKRGRKLHY